ncbi:MAG: hypothetical protein QM658_07685 [Gordonia sp. (in: high G+C Gram-positive bacteria)]
MSPDVIMFVVSGALIVAGVALREAQVGDDGALSRGWAARALTVATLISVAVTASLTLDRLLEMAL